MLHELEHSCPPTIISKGSLNVRFWHKADITARIRAAVRSNRDSLRDLQENGRQFGGLKVGSGEDPSPESDADRQVCK
jgi:hypothetical protein